MNKRRIFSSVYLNLSHPFEIPITPAPPLSARSFGGYIQLGLKIAWRFSVAVADADQLQAGVAAAGSVSASVSAAAARSLDYKKPKLHSFRIKLLTKQHATAHSFNSIIFSTKTHTHSKWPLPVSSCSPFSA